MTHTMGCCREYEPSCKQISEEECLEKRFMVLKHWHAQYTFTFTYKSELWCCLTGNSCVDKIWEKRQKIFLNDSHGKRNYMDVKRNTKNNVWKQNFITRIMDLPYTTQYISNFWSKCLLFYKHVKDDYAREVTNNCLYILRCININI